MSGAWRPLLDGDEARRARVVIDRVARALADGTRDGSSLEAGQAGIALMMAALAREGDEEAADRAVAAAERAADALPEAPWLLSGMAGIAWVIEHVRDLIEPDEEGLEEIDRALARLVALPTWPFEVELRAGLAGIAVYALARAGRADADRVLVGALDHLERLAVRRGDGAVWLSPPDAGDQPAAPRVPHPHGAGAVAGGDPRAVRAERGRPADQDARAGVARRVQQ
ncbi:MAG TPA: lanthionine synthetase LanC family protein, partial [Kofleriaceae bacterium]|nr:lanthionine synthetase LanC family protein [Kofleriaceae bacterium]